MNIRLTFIYAYFTMYLPQAVLLNECFEKEKNYEDNGRYQVRWRE